jgi:hypothetical protein
MALLFVLGLGVASQLVYGSAAALTRSTGSLPRVAPAPTAEQIQYAREHVPQSGITQPRVRDQYSMDRRTGYWAPPVHDDSRINPEVKLSARFIEEVERRRANNYNVHGLGSSNTAWQFDPILSIPLQPAVTIPYNTPNILPVGQPEQPCFDINL